MRAWQVHELGEPAAVMRFEELDEPTAGRNQILVRVRAASINFPDA